MLKSLYFFVRYFIFWIVFFFLNRLIFEIWHLSKINDSTFLEIAKTFAYGLHMDASMTGYFCVIPFLILMVSLAANKKLGLKFIKYYTFTLVIITSIITVVDINVVREWGTKFNHRAIDFLLDAPGDALASSSSSPVIASFSSIGLLILLGIFLYKKIVSKYDFQISKTHLSLKLISIITILGLTFLAIRGGTGVAPMNPSKVYFSSKSILNLAAINSDWFLMSNVISSKKTKGNPYKYFSDNKLKIITDSLFKSSSNYPEILNTKRPNIIIIIMESFTADLVKELGREKDVTPNFSKLVKEGLLFKHIYSASDRTDKGIVAVISGYPSQAIKSVIKENDKQANLPSLPGEFAKIGYQTSFVYGGDLDFSNFKSYLFSHDINQIKDLNNFDIDAKPSQWGFSDDLAFDKEIELLKTAKQPFFAGMLTLSNHEPFDLKGPYKFGNNNNGNKFRSTSYFTDQALYKFINDAKKESWYKNTLFVIVADHGHRLPNETFEISDPDRYHIPLLFLGGALKNEFKSKTIDKVGNQIDIASILLNQLHLPDTSFYFSKNLLSPDVKGFAFFSWDNGFGYVNQNKAITYDPVGNYALFKSKTLKNKEEENEMVENAKGIMQSIYTNYLGL